MRSGGDTKAYFTLLTAMMVGAPVSAGATGLDVRLSLCLADQSVVPAALWHAWSFAPEVTVPLLVALALYAVGLRRRRWHAAASPLPAWRAACFFAGWLTLAIGLVSPLCRMAATLASAHMAQHLILIAVAPPLLCLGAPFAVMPYAVPRWRSALKRWARSPPARGTLAAIRAPMVAGALYGGAIWFWHIPFFYQTALLSAPVHLVMYATLLSAGLLFWHSLISTASRDPNGQLGALASSLVTTVHTGVLGALLTFSPSAWYPLMARHTQAWGLTPLEDQQLAGLIMWVPMGLAYVCVTVVLGAVWMAAMERRSRLTVRRKAER